jgi:nitrite reductase/ring-hydroxylating ferredoxin subunit
MTDPHLHDTPSCAATCGVRGALDRREFLFRGALAAAAVALAACGGASDSTAPSSVGLTIKLADYPALEDVGGMALINAGGSPLAVVRTSTSTFVALSRVCPHQGATVSATSSGFTCPQHGARFSTTGTWIGGQRTSNMYSYPATYDATAGTIAIG